MIVSFLTIIFSPLFCVLALLIKVDSKGSVFYRGSRTGKNGHAFRIYKFRTMVENAENLGGYSTSETDKRITRLGRHLRKYKIDELPQLINVLKGDMSLVGPRPEVKAYTDLYTGEELAILTVRPGITDLASIEYRNLDAILALSSDPDQYYRTVIRPKKNALRLYYVRNRSLLLDVKILIQTVFSTVMGYKSYHGISASRKN